MVFLNSSGEVAVCDILGSWWYPLSLRITRRRGDCLDCEDVPCRLRSALVTVVLGDRKKIYRCIYIYMRVSECVIVHAHT